MNGSSAQNSIDLRISRSCKKIITALISAAAIVGSLVLPASASELIVTDTSDWLELEADPHLFYCPRVLNDSSLQELEIGMNYTDYPGEHFAIVLSAGIPIYKDCTYVLEFTAYKLYASRHDQNFVITDSLPNSVTDLGVQYNSQGTAYIDTISYVDEYKSNTAYKWTFTFSTAEGYIDNSPTGDCYVNLLQINDYNQELYESVIINISEISAKCIMDPSAEYYLEITKQRQNKLVELTKESVGKMKDSLEQVTIIDDMSSAVDYVSGAIGNAAALISPTATFAGNSINIYPAFALFSTIYNNVLGSVDPALLAVAATVPLLCFLAWIFSSLFKSLL